MQKVIVFSNKFSPAHFSHLVAFYKSFQKLNFDCTLALDKQYINFLTSYNEKTKYKINQELNENDKADIILIYNISTIDTKYINLVKKDNTRVFVIIHEPWSGFKKAIKNYITKKEPLKETLKSLMRKFYLNKLLKQGAVPIVCSKNAANIYNKHLNKKDLARIFSLIFENENKNGISLDNKKYFSFIGSATPAHGFKEYLEFVKNNKDKDILFQIATSSKIKDFLNDEDLQKMIKSKKLVVKEGNYMSNEEINEAYRNSIATWMVYKRSTQSGVICKSMMFGTPVICSKIGSFDEYVNGSNGVILEEVDNREIKDAYFYIKSNLNNMSKECINSFDKYFNYEHKLEQLKEIIDK